MLNKDDILQGLSDIDAIAKRDGILIEMSVYGGAALCLAFDLRESTKDVDVFISKANALAGKLSAEVAQQRGWDIDWLNDGVKGFLSHQEDMIEFSNPDGSSGLRVWMPSGEYMFAMKCMAMRSSLDGSSDKDDIVGLAKILGISSSAEAFDIIGRFYPAAKLPSKVSFGIDEIFQNISPSPT